MKESGLIYSIMRHALRAYRKDPDLLINTMDVFVKEPSLDWKVSFLFFFSSFCLYAKAQGLLPDVKKQNSALFKRGTFLCQA